jgi:hypothetical protein
MCGNYPQIIIVTGMSHAKLLVVKLYISTLMGHNVFL